MAYPFVQAAFDYGPRPATVRAFLVHMAEGGGTVGYLAGAPARGVSVHYVIEYSGRIVQMLREDHASGSVNPALLRTTDDLDRFYGVTAARAVMGPSWSDPNTAVISVEIEGFQARGPSIIQADALVRLVDDVRSRHAAIGLLGHRDFASYKACPGKLIDWTALGGHGKADDMIPAPITDETPKIVTAGIVDWYDLDNRTVISPKAGHSHPLAARPSPYGVGTRRAIYATVGTRRVVLLTPLTAVPVPPPVVDCDDVVTTELGKAAIRAADAVRSRA